MYYCYLLENQGGKIYIGQTSDLEKRLMAHNTDAYRWTSGKGPWNLIHFEEFDTRSKAMFREKQLKSMKAGKRIKELLHIP